MRRAISILAGLVLTALLAASAVAAPPTAKSSFNGDFDVLFDGAFVGHITARIPADSSTPGTWVFDGPTWHNTGVISEPAYYHNDTYNEVWFNGVEVGSPDPAYRIFTGHFVDVLDPATPDYVEFWTTTISENGFFDVSFAGTFHNEPPWTVGAGAFVLKVRGT